MSEISNKPGLISSITVYSDRFKVYYASNGVKKNSFADDVKLGLTSPKKFLLPKYFYDNAGSDLFEKICETPEYYVTRTETGIIKQNSEDIAGYNFNKKILVELGSGSSQKTRYLLKSFINNYYGLKYIPVDVSEILITSSLELLEEFDNLKIDGIHSEYEKGLLIAGEVIKEPKMILFLGSSIGNFNLHDALEFIKLTASIMSANDSFLIGFDMVKDINVLDAAYNDKDGITAQFNLNLLKRINNELNGEFDLSKFRHKAFYNADDSRIEMHLVSLAEQDIFIHEIREKIHFDEGETIHTENSYKFTDEMINKLASDAGLAIEKVWKDEKDYFALCLMRLS